MKLQNLNPFRRRDLAISDLQNQIDNLTTSLADFRAAQAGTNSAVSDRLDLIARADSLLEVLSRIDKSTAYTAAAERHDRQANLKRHEF